MRVVGDQGTVTAALLASSLLVLASACSSTGATAFSAVWQPGSGAQWWRAGMTVEEFEAQDDIYFDQGLRIQLLAVRNGRFTVVWRPGSGTQWWRAGMTVAELEDQDEIYFDQGLRISALEAEDGKFTAVWRPGSGTQWWHAGMTLAEFKEQDRAYFDQGLRIAALELEDDRFTAVWQPGSGAQWWHHRMCSVDFESQDAAYFNNALRLGALELLDDPVSAFRYPWKSGDSYVVGQGNDNPSGSHNGSQRYAFDFSLPAGTEIRAASAGTVEWLQENQTTTYDPSQPTTATNTPFPNGSLQNWGNAVRIRHAGGLTSWYFHLQTNGVLVEVGDMVERGQPIAISGNTGRSSGAHLHFQVQPDSIDWGQSVPISFGDCEVPTTGTTVKSNNANPNFP